MNLALQETDMTRTQRAQPRKKRGRPGAVLLCYDGSDLSKAAIAQAGRELGPGRRALVLKVWGPFAETGFFRVPVSAPGLADQVKRQAERIAGEGTALARQAGFDAEPLVKRGVSAWQRIAEVAKERDVDLIVLGSHGRSGLGYLLHGSVATAVAQHAGRPVLIVSGSVQCSGLQPLASSRRRLEIRSPSRPTL